MSHEVIIRRLPDLDRFGHTYRDLQGNAMTKVYTNVPWTCVQHSPTGFEFGYGGSGPADLALNILSAFLPAGDESFNGGRELCYRGSTSYYALTLYQLFKRDFIAPLDQRKGGTIDVTSILKWLRYDVPYPDNLGTTLAITHNPRLLVNLVSTESYIKE